jgi:hypothetical protein
MSTISAESLRADQYVLVRGHTSFSRLARLIEGPELEKRAAEGAARGQQYPTNVPHTTISLVDPTVIFEDPNAPTQEELYVQGKFFQLHKGANAGKTSFSIDNKSTNLANVFEPDPDNPGSHRQLILGSDLATGLDVTLVLRTFKPKNHPKKGLGLQQIILHEAPRYFSQSVNTEELAARGITISGPVTVVDGHNLPNSAPLTHSTTVVADDGLPMPGPSTAAPAPQAQAETLEQELARLRAEKAANEAPAETLEQELARLRAEKAANEASGGQSAFTGTDAAVNPWGDGVAPEGSFRG